MDTGYGNALNVVRAVREFERTGVSGFHLEDQAAPKKCGHYEGKELVSTAEMVGKIHAAVDTRQDAEMVLIARTDARAVEGFDAAIERLHRYLEAGADVAFFEAPQSIEEMRRIPPLLGKAAMVNIFEGGKTPVQPAPALQAMGFSFGIYPSQTHRAAIFAVKEVLEHLRKEGNTEALEPRLATFQDREVAVNTAKWNARDRKYLG
jgi:2-methylisocitrate lyase-like PEP mutase family enzyme